MMSLKNFVLAVIAAVSAQSVATRARGSVLLSDDWDELYSVMENILTVMDGMDQQWGAVMDNTIGQIGVMAGRIVYTEKLINAEGLEIGDMADRIVQTEHILSNLTSNCLNCTPSVKGVNARARGRDEDPGPEDVPYTLSSSSEPVVPTFDRCFACEVQQLDAVLWRTETAGTPGAVPGAPTFGDDPITPLLEFMNHTLNLMKTMSSNVSTEMSFMGGQIGIMADRIVGTECLIMNMSGQIGTMASRIVLTEQMLANVSETCCHATHGTVPASSGSGRPNGASAIKTGLKNCSCSSIVGVWDGTKPAESLPLLIVRLQSRFKLEFIRPSPADRGSSCSPLDPICMAIAEMTKIAQAMEDAMFNMCLQMVNETTSAAVEVGKLADHIVNTENEIVNMGQQIGSMADLIVDVESTMCRFAEHVCHTANGTRSAGTRWVTSHDTAMNQPRRGLDAGGAVSGPLHSDTAARTNAMNMSVHTLRAVAARSRALKHWAIKTLASIQVAVVGMPPVLSHAARARVAVNAGVASTGAGGQFASATFPNPAKWMALMEQVMQKMIAMSGRMLKNMSEIMDGIASMASMIGQTSELVVVMAAQINQMASRIANTMNIVKTMANDCKV